MLLLLLLRLHLFVSYSFADEFGAFLGVACRAKAGKPGHHKPTAEAKHADLPEPMLRPASFAAKSSETGHLAGGCSGVSSTLVLLLLLHSSQLPPPTVSSTTAAMATTSDFGGEMTTANSVVLLLLLLLHLPQFLRSRLAWHT